MPLVGGTSNPKIQLDAYVDTSNFDEKMASMDARVDALSEGYKRQGELITQTAQKSTMSWTDFRSMYSTVLDVVRVGQQVWEETGQKYVDNAVKVGDMARSLGTTTEEASRLKEVADDVGISVQSLTTAFKLAQKDGFSPTVEGLAKMSDEYLKLQPGVERTQFLLDRFGRSGEEMGKLLDKGSASIRAQSAAIEEGLIVTQKAYEQARQYQVSVDELKDSWDSLTYQAAPPLVGAMTGIINRSRDLFTSLKENGYWYTVTHQWALQDITDKRRQADSALLSANTAGQVGDAFESEAEKTKRLSEETKRLAEEQKAISDFYVGEISLINSMQSAEDSYTKKTEDLTEKRKESQAKLAEFRRQGYSEQSTQIQGELTDLEKIKQAEADLEAERQRQSLQFISGILAENLARDGWTQSEFDAFAKQQEAWGLWSADTVAKAQAAMAAANAVTASIEAIPTNKTTTIDVWTNHYESYSGNSQAAPMHHQALGNSWVIPNGYGNEGYRMGNDRTASPGETVTVTPPGQKNKQLEFDYAKMGRAVGKYVAMAISQRGG